MQLLSLKITQFVRESGILPSQVTSPHYVVQVQVQAHTHTHTHTHRYGSAQPRERGLYGHCHHHSENMVSSSSGKRVSPSYLYH